MVHEFGHLLWGLYEEYVIIPASDARSNDLSSGILQPVIEACPSVSIIIEIFQYFRSIYYSFNPYLYRSISFQMLHVDLTKLFSS